MIRVSISIKFCIKQTSYKLDVVFRNPGTDGTRNVINVSTPSHSGVLYKVQTVAQLRDCYVLVGAAQIEIQYTYGHYMYIREAILNPNSSTLEPDRPQHIGPTACITPSSILPPPSSRCVSFTQEKKWACLSTILLFHFSIFF